MNFLILIITSAILVETSILCVKNSKKPLINSNQKRKLYVDTSALMDPRLLGIAKTGFISDDFIIPRSVIHELQFLADGKDRDKRIRARAGLDVISELERVIHFNLTILDDVLDHTPVDNRLLELAKNSRGAILTNDYNLKKVATTEHIDALNINELALALRNEYFPGDHAKIRITGTGSGKGQGVGYLHDGTMVVVEHANNLVGEEIEVEFIRLNQTAAGSMMFANLVPPKSSTKTSVLKRNSKKRPTPHSSKTIKKK